MRKVIKYSFSLVLILLFASCSTSRLKYTQIDLLRPAKVTFDAKIKRVLVVDDEGKRDYSKFIRDSIPYFCVASVAENLQMKSFFHSVQLAKENTKGKLKNDVTLIKSLCKKYNVDAIISLSSIGCNYDKVTNSWENYASLDMKLSTFWNVYTADKSLSKELFFTDDFSWEVSIEDLKKLPNVKDAYVDASILTGANVVERLIPSWEKQDRYFFYSKDKKMKQAMDEVVKKDWQKAISIWSKVASNKSSSAKLKYHAHNNTAIAYEILGDINKAVFHTDKAIDLYYNESISGKKEELVFEDLLQYKDFLLERKKEISLLKKQLANE